MERFLVAGGLIVAAVAVAYLVQRRREASAMAVRRSELPSAVDLAALSLPEGPISESPISERPVSASPVFVVFTEETCRTCAAALAVVRGPAGAGLPVVEVPFGRYAAVHRRHGIDSVPTTVVADVDGRVVDGWVGRVDLSGLAAALAQVVTQREPPDQSA